MKVWITKHALTTGIEVLELSAKFRNGSISARVPGENKTRYVCHKDWCDTWEAAKKKAEDMQTKKLLSLRLTTRRVFNIEFENPDQEVI